MSAPRVIDVWRGLTAGSSGAAGIRRYPARDDWYDISWNPTAGCSAVSPGCDNCWAMRVAAQLARMGGATAARYTRLTRMERTGPVWTGEIRVRDDLLTWPLFRRQPRRIAVSLMSDLFHEALTTATIDLVHAVIAVAHWHTFLVLTKRSPRMREYYGDSETPRRIAEEITRLSSKILPTDGTRTRAAALPTLPGVRRTGRARTIGPPRHWISGFSRVRYATPGATPSAVRPVGLEPWPLPNLWLGVSVEDQSRIGRIGDLLKMPAAIRWVCFEPLLDRMMPDAVPAGDGYFDCLAGGHYAIDGRGRRIAIEGAAWRPLDWVVAGGEIGVGARPTHPDRFRSLRDQCIAAGVPFFFRQWASGLRDPGKSPRGPWSASASALRAASSMAVAGTRYRERYGPISDLARFRVVAANTVPARAMRCDIGNENYSGRYRAILWIGARATRQRKTTDQGRRWCPGAELNHRHTDFQSLLWGRKTVLFQ